MFKILGFLAIFLSLFLIIFPNKILADQNSFVTVVNPVRGNDFWELKDQKPTDAIAGQQQILKSQNIVATWLIRPDTLLDQNIIKILKLISSTDELGLFLEITPSWTNQAKVEYQKSANWHSAGSVFLTGYSVKNREKLIDSAFEDFKKNFGFYPKSVGAWFVDAYSLQYMQKKYQINSALIVADQYSTDNYQIWGQYWQSPYYPQKRNTLAPAQTLEDKLPIVVMQWAARDPVNGYGKAVEESTYSVQANDYIDYHSLDINYFSKLVDIYTNQKFNKFNQLVVGLENSYSWSKYKNEYLNQINVISTKQKSGQFLVVTMNDFAKWYKSSFPEVSPEQIVIADDPLGSSRKTVWFMNPYYRVGWFYNSEGSVIRDVRQYLESQEQLCYEKLCQNLNFATAATRVLDDVSFHRNFLIDEGRISSINFGKSNQGFFIEYINDAQRNRRLDFLLRDISIDGVISSIDGTILNATKTYIDQSKVNTENVDTSLKSSLTFLLADVIKFFLFSIFVLLIPGMVLLNFKRELLDLEKVFLSVTIGLVSFTLITYFIRFLRLDFFVPIYLLLINLYFIYSKKYKDLLLFRIDLKSKVIYLILLLGIIFQILPTVKTGLSFGFGLGFWGPNAHDGVWHIALVNQLEKNLPPLNPIYSGAVLKNYHYLYDLLISLTANLTTISPVDLVFRLYPLLFSTMLGVGTVVLFKKMFQDYINEKKLNVAIISSLFFVYFAGSFGWIVTYLHERVLSGESSFWANQAVSFNLNPPFAISLIIIIACLVLFKNALRYNFKNSLLLGLLVGSLIGFKAYGAIILFLSIFIIWVINLRNRLFFRLFLTLVVGGLISLGIYLPNFSYSSTFIFQPFWLIDTMIDFPDRVGWLKLSSARTAYFERKEWLKFFLVELISFLLFLIGNLGVRFLGLFTILKFKKIRSDLLLQFIFAILIFSFLIPLFFTQVGTAWNTIQFLYYFLYFMALFAGFVISFIFDKFPKGINFVVIIFLLIITPINSIATAWGYTYNRPHAFISNFEMQALSFLKDQPDGVVLTFPFNKDDREKFQGPLPLFVYETTAYVSAFSEKTVFLEDEIQNDILNLDNSRKRVKSKVFFDSLGKENGNFLIKENIKYIYLQKYYKINLEENNEISKIFENQEILIYKVK
ncbi:hypothetical protein HY025_00075 [Candidatus Daviesbacteria bacterium]|nr:hypothetical protein [Candidatus Daviesbacteria bacterium]